MENVAYQTLKNILQIVNVAQYPLDQNAYRHTILDALSKNLHVDSSIFILPDENAKFTDFMGSNVDEKYIRTFKEYYHRQDPFKLIPGLFYKKSIVRLEELVDYPSFLRTEYYNDFLRPQEIYYKIIARLGSRGKSVGLICLFRPEGSNNFSQEEINMISTLSPYIAHVLNHIELYQRKKLMDNIFEIIENNWSTGLLLLDDSMKLIYMNQRAKEFCNNMFGYTAHRKKNASVSPILLQDCLSLKEELKQCKSLPMIPKYRVIQGRSAQKFSVHSQIIEKDISSENHRLFMVSIEEVEETADLGNFNRNSLRERYHLTKREIDIVSHIFKGLRNAEIAQELFVSEITVKKHIHNIFEKVSVTNRTALIHKILTNESNNI